MAEDATLMSRSSIEEPAISLLEIRLIYGTNPHENNWTKTLLPDP